MPNLKLGIVGLPNVGKSSLFNALTAAGAPAENYPFCTVEPNVGVVEVPDQRVHQLAASAASRSTVPAVVHFVDIAGLVKGAAAGQGLGNRFLANIRQVDAIVHVVRCFDDPDVAHVMGDVDPVRDREIVNTELALADLELVERRLDRVSKVARSGEKATQAEAALLERLVAVLSEGRPARLVTGRNAAEAALIRGYQLLTTKRELYLANVAESDLPSGENPYVVALRAAIARDDEPAEIVPLATRIEAEVADLAPRDRAAFLGELGLQEPGLHRLVRAGYTLLELISFFTTSDKETRAWTIRRGTNAAQAGGEIHTDFERGFIRAETIGWDEFVLAGSLKAAREMGLVRAEGREYVVQDGDIILFRFNV